MRIMAKLGIVALTLGALACGPSIDVATSLEVTDVTSGWYDKGIVNGMNKLVPSVTFKVRNRSGGSVDSVQFNAVFRVVDDPQELGSHLIKGIDRSGLAPGASTEAFTLQSALGYTGQQPRVEMLSHSDFRDVRVDVYGKYRSDTWTKLASIPVERKLLAAAPHVPVSTPAGGPGQ